MDKLYTGDIPQDYKYARFGSNYIDLFNQQILHNNVYNYYRVYLYDDLFIYAQDTYTASQYQTVTLPEITVTNDWHYRNDLDSIYTCAFMLILIITLCLNVMTSLIRKGGALGGLF